MLRLILSGMLLIAALGMSTQLAHAQKMPGRKACGAGMTFQQCLDRCIQLAGHGKKTAGKSCPKRCAKRRANDGRSLTLTALGSVARTQ